MDEIWGISDGGFLLSYVGVIAIVLGVRAAIAYGVGRRHRVTPTDIALLLKHPTVDVSVMVLRAAGAIGASRPGHVVATGPPPSGASPHDLAVHRAVETEADLATVEQDAGVQAARQQATSALQRSGLLLGGWRRRIRAGIGHALVPLFAIGLVRFIWQLVDGRSAWVLGILLFVVTPVAWWLLMATALDVPHRTRRGNRTYLDYTFTDATLDPGFETALFGDNREVARLDWEFYRSTYKREERQPAAEPQPYAGLTGREAYDMRNHRGRMRFDGRQSDTEHAYAYGGYEGGGYGGGGGDGGGGDGGGGGGGGDGGGGDGGGGG